ncbi:acetyl esterase/lipase [Microbacterium endophyticum]|uniref:Acetyl esterase/lipase n=1 Tax=Microbacterium endophyticum TaxID=1526412 RepID=A0A7W4V0B4_9MICO|nr:alpha/beta hydrolase [Microbacterium endophyticum]MBB2974536.1 acetyl esterase/lipase [Microbacterium endophyticum]NIK36833.1 acetyl esterase/lipase [Microbacterium endophyticum]
MTPSLPDALVPIALKLLRANRTFITADGAMRRIRERELRPASYGPPARLGRGIRVDVEHVDGWPVYTIRPKAARGGLVYVHGGGWVNEIASQHWHLAARLASEASLVVTLPIYPLVPFGTALEALEGVRALVHRSHDYFGPTSLAGDSAGGQIALSTALALRDEGVVLPHTVLISPALDLSWSNPRIPEVQPTDPWLGTPGGKVLSESWRGDLELSDPTVSPLFGDLTGLGPITVFTGTRDVLNPDAHVLAKIAGNANVPFQLYEAPNQVHVYPLIPTRAGRDAQSKFVEILRSAW